MKKPDGLRRSTGIFLGSSALGPVLSLALCVPANAAEAPAAANGQTQTRTQPQQPQPERVIITGPRPEDFRARIPTLQRLTEPLINTPQSIDVISEQLLRARAVTNLNDALKNVPGISIGAGEFSWQGNNPTIRGFVARSDMFLDGIRDFGNYFRDPFYMQSIEVLQGPSSILFGRGSTGGVINQSSKHPELEGFTNGNLVGGSDYTRRAVADFDAPVAALGDHAAVRVNAMYHAQSVAGRNIVKQNRYGFAPSLALGIGTPTRLTASYYHLTADDIPDYGHPWFGGSPAPVPRRNFYGFSTDYLKTGTNVATVRAEHDLAPGITIRNTSRFAYYTRNFRITEPIVTAPIGTDPALVNVNFNIFSGASIETMAWNQLDAQIHFNTGTIEHTVVAGVEGGRETSSPNFDNSAGVPSVSLLYPDPQRPFIASSTFPRFDSNARAWSFGAYMIDTLKFGERWELNAGLRYDTFDVTFSGKRFSVPPAPTGVLVGVDNVRRSDARPNYRFAAVYKPQANASIYLAHGTSFNPSAESLTFLVNARGFPISNRDLAPEENDTIELGTKWDLMDGMLSATGSIFRLTKQNARAPDPTRPGFNTLQGEQRVDGVQVGLLGRITEDWQLSFGYTHLDGKVVKSSVAPGAAAAAPDGAPMVQTPKNTIGFFTEYRLTPEFEIGGGGQMSSSRYASNVAPIKIAPGFWTFDLFAKYDFNEKMSVQVNVNNILDRYYYEGLHPFHIVPGAGRTALLTLNFRY
jgi:catecholate siderophore receptor